MARRTLNTFKTLWERHEKLYTEIFEKALIKLSKKDSVRGNEDTISESLCPILHNICFDLNKRRNCEIRPPAWEKPVQPISKNELIRWED